VKVVRNRGVPPVVHRGAFLARVPAAVTGSTGRGEMRTGFVAMRGKLDQSAAGQRQIDELSTGLNFEGRRPVVSARPTPRAKQDRLVPAAAGVWYPHRDNTDLHALV
jgi:hypothetical protein